MAIAFSLLALLRRFSRVFRRYERGLGNSPNDYDSLIGCNIDLIVDSHAISACDIVRVFRGV